MEKMRNAYRIKINRKKWGHAGNVGVYERIITNFMELSPS
jgi:hypothetical protein